MGHTESTPCTGSDLAAAADTEQRRATYEPVSFPRCSIINESYVLGLFGAYRKLIYQHMKTTLRKGARKRGREEKEGRERENRKISKYEEYPNILTLSVYYLFYIFEIYYGGHLK